MIALIRYLFIRDFWLKLLSLIFAVFIWFTVKKIFLSREIATPISALGAPMAEQTYVNVPVLVIFPAAEVRNVDVQPSEVQVTVQADIKALKNLKADQIHAQIDLTGTQPDPSLRKRIEVILPPGFTYTRVVPDEVDVVVPAKK